MKKLLFLLSICLIGFYACKKSDNNAPNSKKIIGKWANTKLNIVETKNGVDSIADHGSTDSLYLQFNANLTGTVLEKGDNEPFTYTLSGNTLTLTETNNPSSAINFNIKTLTSTDLVLRITGPEQDGITENEDYYFTKQ